MNKFLWKKICLGCTHVKADEIPSDAEGSVETIDLDLGASREGSRTGKNCF